MRCRVCSHPEREVIEDTARASSAAGAAAQWGVSELALERHLASHPPSSRVRPVATADEEAPITSRSPERHASTSSRLVTVVLRTLEGDSHAVARAAVLEALVEEALPGDLHVETRQLVIGALERERRTRVA